ncbi:MAG: hypothetical protein DWQ47_14705 [Acidobacteria bacterium]|nr:MAG: hypothetical protein DWQ32_02105 [Acidobacteriota bacterium]REK02683.1 MAG: hypothetical protein DWQ38_10030 [Acidobacteriota bacterium]REK13512.1 MAG: hypothetical protein DWQ43_07795 [Acidobacteriota bacterium]REK41506.1 MAG: hypothetical protein DWQ47_14705 [Acidobacteriota bacterium]
MDSLKHLKRLYRYNDWANRRVIAVLKQHDCPDAVRVMSHVLITEKEYYERMFGKDSTGFDFWPDADPEGLGALAMKNAEDYERLLENFDDEGLGQIIRYRTSAGSSVKNTFRDVLSHVALHSAGHRGQALTLLRQSGIEPPVVDYIIYRRELQ